MSDNKQKSMIHQLTSILGLQKEVYKEMLHSSYEVDSSKDLTYKQASDFVTFLKKKAVDAGLWECKKSFNKHRHNNLANRKGMASPKQLRKIEAMWFDVSVQKTDEARQDALQKLIKRIVKVEDIRFVNHYHAEKIIKTLESMKQQKETKL
jgi:hypothetical protein